MQAESRQGRQNQASKPCFSNIRTNSSSKPRLAWCSRWFRMWVTVASVWEMLTLNAAYPSCHSNCLPVISCNQRDEFALRVCTAFANAIVAGSNRRTCTWSWIPPTAIAFIPRRRAMPPIKAQSRGWSSAGIEGARPFVLNTQWTRRETCVCFMAGILIHMDREIILSSLRDSLYVCDLPRHLRAGLDSGGPSGLSGITSWYSVLGTRYLVLGTWYSVLGTRYFTIIHLTQITNSGTIVAWSWL